MNKRHKTLSLLLSVGIAAPSFPCTGTGATNDSIAFYNSKKNILDMREYDEAYDTNHDGVVNVFDVIRENKEVFQEESYTDLKVQIHLLETQIEILTQKLNEKEDKTQAESDFFKINSDLSEKVNLQDGKQLSSNDYTNEEKQKLEYLNNYDDTSIKSDISEISSALSGKVDSQEGKQLSSNDYTNADKEKLNDLNNYDDTLLRLEISESLSGKVDNQEGKQLSSNDFTDADKSKLEGLNNYDDTEIKSEIVDIKSNVSLINEAVSGKVDQQEGKQLSSNDYTNEEKQKLESIQNYDDSKINKKIDTLVQAAYEEKNKMESSIQSKVDKEEGKQLSSNDYTNEEKQKLENLNNYDDTQIKSEINDIKSVLSQFSINNGFTASGNLAEGDCFKTSTMSIKTNCSYTASFEPDTLGEVRIGHGVSGKSFTYLSITPNAWKVNTDGKETILRKMPTPVNSSYFQVFIKVGDDHKALIKIQYSEDSYTYDGVDWCDDGLQCNYIECTSGNISNVMFGWSCSDIGKPVYMFGDSYFNIDTNTTWPYHYLKDFNNVLFSGFGGANSLDSNISFSHILEYSAPSVAVLCTGMNDGSDDETVNTIWEKQVSEFIAKCKSNNITPVLSTIPTVPTINHEKKNEWVRNSGYRYIDFAKAVGAQSNGTWYENMLSSDGVHPTARGACALYYQAIRDVPEIAYNQK